MTVMLVLSLFDVGGDEIRFENHYQKWFIYLTNWNFFMAFFQTWLASIITLQALVRKDHDHSEFLESIVYA
jgi:hypothetical protein